jgi:hypothetical protein
MKVILGMPLLQLLDNQFVMLEPITNKFVMINVQDPSSNFTKEELSLRCKIHNHPLKTQEQLITHPTNNTTNFWLYNNGPC